MLAARPTDAGDAPFIQSLALIERESQVREEGCEPGAVSDRLTDANSWAGSNVAGRGIPFSTRELTQEKMRIFRYPA